MFHIKAESLEPEGIFHANIVQEAVGRINKQPLIPRLDDAMERINEILKDHRALIRLSCRLLCK